MAGIVFYVSGHGFGHAVRSAQVIGALRAIRSDLPIWVRTPAPAWLFPGGLSVESVQLDVGVVQRGSLYVRPVATLSEYADVIATEPAVLAREAAFVTRVGARCLAADIPSAAFEIASRAGVPGVAIANFCWDWIYEPYAAKAPGFRPVLEHIRQQERLAQTLLRLPFAGDLSHFRKIRDIPMIARRSSADQGALRRRFGIDTNQPVALLSFGGYGLDEATGAGLARWRDWLFVTATPGRQRARQGNLLELPSEVVPYVDFLAMADAVITKPGYGIVSDCLANQVPVLYSDRGRFREYAVLAGALRRYGRAVFIPRAALTAGDVGPYLDRLMSLTRPWALLPTDGAEVAARYLLEIAEGHEPT